MEDCVVVVGLSFARRCLVVVVVVVWLLLFWCAFRVFSFGEL